MGGVRYGSNFTFLLVNIHLSQDPFIEETVFSPLSILPSLVNPLYLVYILALKGVSLVYCFDDCSFFFPFVIIF